MSQDIKVTLNAGRLSYENGADTPRSTCADIVLALDVQHTVVLEDENIRVTVQRKDLESLEDLLKAENLVYYFQGVHSGWQGYRPGSMVEYLLKRHPSWQVTD